MLMNKKDKKIISIVGLSISALIIGVILVVGFIYYEIFVRPANNAISEAKSKATYLLLIPDKTTLKKVGEAGMAETIDNNNHCYTYAFQGSADYLTTKNTVKSLLKEAGYYLEPKIVVDSESAYKVQGKAMDGWTTRLQVLNNTALEKVAEGVIDNPVSTKAQNGLILVSGQVCNI